MDEGSLEQKRAEIDSIDGRLIALLGDRLRICIEIARMKRRQGLAVMQPMRVEQVKERVAEHAMAAGIDPNFARALWDAIIAEACRLEEVTEREAVS